MTVSNFTWDALNIVAPSLRQVVARLTLIYVGGMKVINDIWHRECWVDFLKSDWVSIWQEVLLLLFLFFNKILYGFLHINIFLKIILYIKSCFKDIWNTVTLNILVFQPCDTGKATQNYKLSRIWEPKMSSKNVWFWNKNLDSFTILKLRGPN